MRRSILLFTILLTSSVMFNSCGGGSDDEAPSVENTNTPEWSLGENDYVAGTSATNQSDGLIAIVLSTSGENGPNGDYAGSGITIAFGANGAGIYEVVSAALLGT